VSAQRACRQVAEDVLVLGATPFALDGATGGNGSTPLVEPFPQGFWLVSNGAFRGVRPRHVPWLASEPLEQPASLEAHPWLPRSTGVKHLAGGVLGKPPR
jgi:hypothetical protein